MTLPTLIRSALLAGTAALSLGAASAQDDVHAPFDAFLAAYLVEEDGMTLLRYGAVTDEDHAALKGYIDDLEALSPSGFGQDEQLAYYFNLYNAAIVDVVLDAYPVDSVREIGGGFIVKGPWKQEVVTVEGDELSFDDIEHGIVRERFDEPRVHYGFNCASFGCPNLKPSAWRAETLDADLDDAARAFVASDRGVWLKGEKVYASSIFKWFQEDFGGSEKGVIAHLLPYAEGEKKAALAKATKISGYDYDWDLNEAE